MDERMEVTAATYVAGTVATRASDALALATAEWEAWDWEAGVKADAWERKRQAAEAAWTTRAEATRAEAAWAEAAAARWAERAEAAIWEVNVERFRRWEAEAARAHMDALEKAARWEAQAARFRRWDTEEPSGEWEVWKFERQASSFNTMGLRM